MLKRKRTKMWEKVRFKGKTFTHCSLLYPLPMIEHNVPTQVFRQLVSLHMFIQLLQGTAHYHLFNLNSGTIQNYHKFVECNTANIDRFIILKPIQCHLHVVKIVGEKRNGWSHENAFGDRLGHRQNFTFADLSDSAYHPLFYHKSGTHKMIKPMASKPVIETLAWKWNRNTGRRGANVSVGIKFTYNREAWR